MDVISDLEVLNNSKLKVKSSDLVFSDKSKSFSEFISPYVVNNGTGTNSLAIGVGAGACGSESIAIGCGSTNIANFSTAIGSASRVHGNYSTAVGFYAMSFNNYTTSIGAYARPSNHGQFVASAFNDNGTTHTQFSVFGEGSTLSNTYTNSLAGIGYSVSTTESTMMGPAAIKDAISFNDLLTGSRNGLNIGLYAKNPSVYSVCENDNTTGLVYKLAYNKENNITLASTYNGSGLLISGNNGVGWESIREGDYVGLYAGSTFALFGGYGGIPIGNPPANPTKGIYKYVYSSGTITSVPITITGDADAVSKSAIWCITANSAESIYVAGMAGNEGILYSTNLNNGFVRSNQQTGSVMDVIYHDGAFYAAMGENAAGVYGILKSTDGITWSKTGKTTGLYFSLISYKDRLYAGSNAAGELIYTEDGGTTWKNITNVKGGQLGYVYSMTIGPDGHLYALNWDTRAIFKTEDGLEWVHCRNLNTSDNAYSICSTSDRLVVGRHSLGLLTVGNEAWSNNVGSAYYGTNGISIGKDNTIPVENSVTNTEFSIAIGNNTNAGRVSIAIGAPARATGTNTIAIGNNSNATDDLSIAIGLNANTAAQNSIALGGYSSASGQYSTALGYSSYATNTHAVAIGDAAASNQYSTALGGYSSAAGQYSTAIGYSSNATQTHAVAIGDAAATGTYSTAIGYNAKASGSYSTSIGYASTAAGSVSFAIGSESKANHNYTAAIGRYITTSEAGQTVLSAFNTAGTARTQFKLIGAGSATSTSTFNGGAGLIYEEYSSNTATTPTKKGSISFADLVTRPKQETILNPVISAGTTTYTVDFENEYTNCPVYSFVDDSFKAIGADIQFINSDATNKMGPPFNGAIITISDHDSSIAAGKLQLNIFGY